MIPQNVFLNLLILIIVFIIPIMFANLAKRDILLIIINTRYFY